MTEQTETAFYAVVQDGARWAVIMRVYRAGRHVDSRHVAHGFKTFERAKAKADRLTKAEGAAK